MDYISNGNEAVTVEVSEKSEKDVVAVGYGKQMASVAKPKAFEGKKSVRDRLK